MGYSELLRLSLWGNKTDATLLSVWRKSAFENISNKCYQYYLVALCVKPQGHTLGDAPRAKRERWVHYCFSAHFVSRGHVFYIKPLKVIDIWFHYFTHSDICEFRLPHKTVFVSLLTEIHSAIKTVKCISVYLLIHSQDKKRSTKCGGGGRCMKISICVLVIPTSEVLNWDLSAKPLS